MERITVDVLLIEGTGSDAHAHVKTNAEPARVPVALIAEGTGFAVDELPGKTVVALVDDGELAGFERA